MTPPSGPGHARGATAAVPTLVRRLGGFDVTMIVMGGIVGAGIFMNPSVVARQVQAPALILGAWIFGGGVALAGAFIYAELAARRPDVGGQYAYLREAFHPLVAFLYGWTLLLVTQSGGMAAVAMTFARYLRELRPAGIADGAVAAIVLATLSAVNCLGVHVGGRVQSVLMVIKIAAVVALVSAGFVLDAGSVPRAEPASDGDSLVGFGAALVPVLFAYGGWQTASFVAGEIRDVQRTLPRALIVGVVGVVALYVSVNVVCLAALGAPGLAATTSPASDVMRLAFGHAGGRLIAAGIAVSTLGFLSQGMLTAPRVYYAMATDGAFFAAVGRVHPRTRVPVVAIALQGLAATAIALSGRYDQILNYVVSADFIFFGLTACTLIVFRHRETGRDAPSIRGAFRVPAHLAVTLAFVSVSWLVVATAVYRAPLNTLAGLGIISAGVPIFFAWRRATEHNA